LASLLFFVSDFVDELVSFEPDPLSLDEELDSLDDFDSELDSDFSDFFALDPDPLRLSVL
jgi:hypothetical protein